jgi:hypothetical protein
MIRQAQGEYVAAVTMIVIVVLFSLLAIQWANMIAGMGSQVRDDITRFKEKLVVIYPCNENASQLCIINDWDGTSVIKGVILIMSNSTAYLCTNNLSVVIPIGGKQYLYLTCNLDIVRSARSVCVFTQNLNMFCNTTTTAFLSPFLLKPIETGLWYAIPKSLFGYNNVTIYARVNNSLQTLKTYIWDANTSWIIFYVPKGTTYISFKITNRSLQILATKDWFQVNGIGNAGGAVCICGSWDGGFTCPTFACAASGEVSIQVSLVGEKFYFDGQKVVKQLIYYVQWPKTGRAWGYIGVATGSTDPCSYNAWVGSVSWWGVSGDSSWSKDNAHITGCNSWINGAQWYVEYTVTFNFNPYYEIRQKTWSPDSNNIITASNGNKIKIVTKISK